MLNKPVDEIVMEGGHVVGVKSEGEVGAALQGERAASDCRWNGGIDALLLPAAGGSLQAAHLRPQLHPRPRPQGRPGDPLDLHSQPPHQKHQRRQLLPDHHSPESG